MNQLGTNGGDREPPSRTDSALEGAAPFAPDLLRRRSPTHLPVADYHNRSIIVFVTVCTQGRKPLLARAEAVETIRQAWAKAHIWRIGRWVVMPDHVHLFCAPGTWPPEPIARWVSFWKSEASRRWPRAEEQPIWQRDFWDTQLRPGDDYRAKWQYVRENPVRAGLCADPETWPFQGEENPLMWTE